MQSVSSKIWTRDIVFISYDDNYYTTAAIDRLSIIWKSYLTDKMKRSFFQAAVVSILQYGYTTRTLTKQLDKKVDGNYTRMLNIEQVLAATPHKAPTIPPPASHHENYTS